MKDYSISKHALNRTIERLVLSQNIRLSKKQVSKNRKRAGQIIANDIQNYFAKATDMSKKYIYIYSKLKDNLCRKYVINRENKIIITVIDNVNLNEEIKKYPLTLKKNNLKITKTVNYNISDYIYTTVNENKYIFVVSNENNKIYSLNCLKECQ